MPSLPSEVQFANSLPLLGNGIDLVVMVFSLHSLVAFTWPPLLIASKPGGFVLHAHTMIIRYLTLHHLRLCNFSQAQNKGKARSVRSTCGIFSSRKVIRIAQTSPNRRVMSHECIGATSSCIAMTYIHLPDSHGRSNGDGYSGSSTVPIVAWLFHRQ